MDEVDIATLVAFVRHVLRHELYLRERREHHNAAHITLAAKLLADLRVKPLPDNTSDTSALTTTLLEKAK